MPVESVIKAINNLDLKQLSLENVELLQKMTPNELEIKAFKEFTIEKKDVNSLTEEDKFVLQLTKVERIASKLSIMNYMGNFDEGFELISPVSVISNNNFTQHYFQICPFHFLANHCNSICIVYCETIK
jgi:formic-like protein